MEKDQHPQIQAQQSSQPNFKLFNNSSFLPKTQNYPNPQIVQIHTRHEINQQNVKPFQQQQPGPQNNVRNEIMQVKTRNFTQMPALKSTPMIQMHPHTSTMQEEDYIDDEQMNMNVLSTQNNHILVTQQQQEHLMSRVHNISSPRHPNSTHELSNAFTARRQPAFQPPQDRSHVNHSVTEEDHHHLQVLKTPYELQHKPSMHARGQSQMISGRNGQESKQAQNKRKLKPSDILNTDYEGERNQYYRGDQEYIMTEEQEQEEYYLRENLAREQDTPDLMMKDNQEEGNISSSPSQDERQSSHALSDQEDASPQTTPNSQQNFANRFQQQTNALGKTPSDLSHHYHQYGPSGNKAQVMFQMAQSHQKHQDNQLFKQQYSLRIPKQQDQQMIASMITSTGQPKQLGNKDCNETVEDEAEGLLETRHQMETHSQPTLVLDDLRSQRSENKPPRKYQQSQVQKIQQDHFPQTTFKKGNSTSKMIQMSGHQYQRTNSENKHLRDQSTNQLFQSGERLQKRREDLSKELCHVQTSASHNTSLQKVNFKSRDNKFTNNQSSNSVGPGSSKPVKNNKNDNVGDDPETEQLKMEYLKLKQTLNQLKCSTINQFDTKSSNKDIVRTPVSQNQRKIPQITARPDSQQQMHLNDLILTTSQNPTAQQTFSNQCRIMLLETGGELTFSNEKLVLETRNLPQSQNRDMNYQNKKKLEFKGKNNQSRENSVQEQRKNIELTAKREASIQQKQKNILIQQQKNQSRSGEDEDGSSFEEFQKASRNVMRLRNGLTTESDSDNQQKQLIVSNLKSVISRQNTTSKNQPSSSANLTQKPKRRKNYDEYSQSSEEKAHMQQRNEEFKNNALQYSPDDECESSMSDEKKYKNHRKQQKSEKIKVTKILKSQKDRKHLKININMNSITGPTTTTSTTGPIGSQKINDPIHQIGEDLLKSQILQQQQILLAALATQHQQNQFGNPLLMLPQLGLQQQNLLLQQFALQGQQYQMLNHQYQHPQHPQSVVGMPTSAPNFSDLLSQYSHSQSVSIPNQPPQHQSDKIYIQRDHSLKSLGQNYAQQSGLLTQRVSQVASQATFDHHISSSLSPARRPQGFNNQMSTNTFHIHPQNVQEVNKLSQLIEDPLSNRIVHQSAQRNYNNPKPLLVGGEQGIGNEYQLKLGQKGKHVVQSRNIIGMQPNYSSPVKPFHGEGVNNQMMHNYNFGEYQHNLSQPADDDQMSQVLSRRTMDESTVRNNVTGHSKKNQEQVQQRKTGRFGETNPGDLIIKRRSNEKIQIYGDDQKSKSSSSGDISIEEGVTASNAHLSMNKSPYAQTFSNQTSVQKEHPRRVEQQSVDITNRNLVKDKIVGSPTAKSQQISIGPTPSSLSRQQQDLDSQVNNDSSEKSKRPPQAILIGFEDDQQLKDPFKDKPVLKNRLQSKQVSQTDINNRSKSVKNDLPKTSLQQKRVPMKTTKEIIPMQETEDRQLRSPNNRINVAKLGNRRITQEISPSKKSAQNISPIKQSNVSTKNKIETQVSFLQNANKQQQQKFPITRPMSSKSSIIESKLLTSKNALNNSEKQQNPTLPQSQGPSKTPQLIHEEPKAVMIDLQTMIKVQQQQSKTPSHVSKKPSVIPESQKSTFQQARIIENFGADDDIIDPSHNQGLVIEILDKKSKNQVEQKEVSLADMFLAKKRNIVDKLETRKAATTTTAQCLYDQDVHSTVQYIDYDHVSQTVTAHSKREKTKEELFELRKAMMKKRPNKREENFTNAAEQVAHVSELTSQSSAKRDPKIELMSRLAVGKKPQVDQKEMKRLTKQNYHNLPEIKKKREEESKKQEHLARKAATQEYLKQLDETRKKKAAAIQKKRAQIMETQSLDAL